MGFFRLYGYELLSLADSIAKEKGVAIEKIISSMESAINCAAAERYGKENDIRTFIDRKTGDVSIGKYYTVVKEITDYSKEVTLDMVSNFKITKILRPYDKKLEEDNDWKLYNAFNDQKIIEYNMLVDDSGDSFRQKLVKQQYIVLDPKSEHELKIGDVFEYEALPLFDFGRSSASFARKVIHRGIKAAEKEKQYNEYKDRVGEIVSGIVKRSEYNNVVVDIGRSEALLKKVNLIPREVFRIGDRVTAYIEEVKYDEFGYQIFLSRNNDNFLQKLLEQQVPEVYDKIIEIKSIARDPGSHAKVAVFCKDPNIDPVGTCVGIRGSRIQPIVQELQGEKIDIVVWSDNIATFIANAMAPAEVVKIVMDQDQSIYEVVVPDAQLSVAIGRRGQNVRLASKLTDKMIDIISESDYQEKRNKEFKTLTDVFVNALDCDEVIANLIVVEGFTKVEQIVEAPLERLEQIEGFDSDLAKEIQDRAKDYLSKKDQLLREKIKELNVDPDILKIKELTLDMIVSLADSNILSLQDLADLSSFELMDILFAYGITADISDNIILTARKMCKY